VQGTGYIRHLQIGTPYDRFATAFLSGREMQNLALASRPVTVLPKQGMPIPGGIREGYDQITHDFF
ncbi:MAG: hypothetical protein ACE5HZ_01780, partial [Fidelibacterota bacterium]